MPSLLGDHGEAAGRWELCHQGEEVMAGRTFATGATRDQDTTKPDYFGFTSALVTKRFGQYMHASRFQSDGSVRASDNWKLGIDKLAYVQSLCRHVEDVKLHFEGASAEAREDLETALCGTFFNVQGLLYEVLRERVASSPAPGEASGPESQRSRGPWSGG